MFYLYGAFFFFFMIRLGSWVTGRKPIGVKCHCHLLPARVHLTDMTYACRCWPWSLGWSSTCQAFHCKIILFPTSLTCISLRTGCPGPSLLWAGPALCCGARASHCSRSSCYGHGLWGVQAQEWRHTGWAALRRVESSWTRAQACVPCPGRPVLNLRPLRKPPTFHIALFGRKSLFTVLTYRMGRFIPPPWGQNIYIHFFGVLHKGFVSSPPCITLFNHLSIFV